MENHINHIRCVSLSVTIFITHVRILRKGRNSNAVHTKRQRNTAKQTRGILPNSSVLVRLKMYILPRDLFELINQIKKNLTLLYSYYMPCIKRFHANNQHIQHDLAISTARGN